MIKIAVPLKKIIISISGLLLFQLHISAKDSSKTNQISGIKVQLVSQNQSLSISTRKTIKSEGVEILHIKMESPTPVSPKPLTVKWSLPSKDIAGVWKSNSYLNKTLKPDWWPVKVKSMLARNAPVMQLFGSNDNNRLTYAISDALNTVEMSGGVREENGRVYCQIKLFTEPHPAIKEYKIDIIFDTRDIPFYSSLQYIASWWGKYPKNSPAHVPEIARTPIYSTWYSYHQNLKPEELIEEVKASARMGFKGIIVDDGWQTMDSNRGYAYTGDWLPERIPQMKKFVQSIHKEGVKFILWYGVPLVGEKSSTYKKFEGKYLRHWKSQGAWELDPRYPAVRSHIIGTYTKAVKEWNIDGLKLDFLGRFVANESTDLNLSEGRDFASVNRATDRLMTDIIKELKKVKPDIMIEFRQPYTGPLMRKYGNMFRVGDCPNSYTTNRVGSVDLRLLSGNTAVHSDMIMWNYEDKVESAALQFLNIIFSVPQVSVRLKDIPNSHFQMIKFITDYWNRNKKILLDGEFRAYNPLGNYPMVSAHIEEGSIYAIYDSVIVYPEKKNFDIINATPHKEVHIRVKDRKGYYLYKVFNCIGELQKKGKLHLKSGTYSIEVPPSGIVQFLKID